MTQEQIHNLFKQRYNQNNWKQFLCEALAKYRLLETSQIPIGTMIFFCDFMVSKPNIRQTIFNGGEKGFVSLSMGAHAIVSTIKNRQFLLAPN